MKWVTWKNVGIDRIGCAWLIRKLVDPDAEFVFINHGDGLPSDAEPFDLPDVKFGHRDGHSSFHTLLEHLESTDPVLLRIARIIDEADTVQAVHVEPAAAGLDLICEGLRLISNDDNEAFEKGQVVYDALYERLRSTDV